MSEVAEKAGEIAAEVVEESIDGTVEVMEIVSNNPKVVAAAAVLGVLAGAGVGYLVAKQQLKSYYEDLSHQEIAEAKVFYAGLYKVEEDGTPLTPQQVFAKRHGQEAAIAALQDYQGLTPDPEEADGEPELVGEPHDDVVDAEQIRKIEARQFGKTLEERGIKVEETVEQVNVFTDDTFDLDEEQKYRTPEAPYIITHAEFVENDGNFDQGEYTYFQVDSVLIDEHDQTLEKLDALVGDDNLTRFGSGSQDRNIVYVRNERLGLDFAITRSKGSYLEEVLGMADKPVPDRLDEG